MSAPQAPSNVTTAAQLSRCVEQLRGGTKEQQKVEFRALIDKLQGQAVTIRDESGRILANGKPVEPGQVTPLLQRMELHNVAEIVIAEGAPPAEVLELLRFLADQPGHDDIPTRLADTGIARVKVALAGRAAAQPSAGLGTEGILRGNPMSDIKSSSIEGVPTVTHDPPPPPPETALPMHSRRVASPALPRPGAAPAEAAAAASRPAPAPPAPTGPPAAPPKSSALPPPMVQSGGPDQSQGASFIDAALQALQREPEGANVAEILAQLGREAELAVADNRFDPVFTIATAVIQLEPKLHNESIKRHYGIVIRRICTIRVLKRAVQLVAGNPGPERERAVVLLRRSGPEGVEVLLDMLVKSQNVAERRAVFDALCQTTTGADQMIYLLGHPEWFVVRNVAELLGELGTAAAIPELTKRLDHTDERVRKAVALALAKIGTPSAAESLRRAFRDKSPDVRLQVAIGVGGKRSSALAMPLVVALESEEDESVQRELLVALGRIGTPDAVQALIKYSHSAGRLFGRRPAAIRLAAVEGLRLAASPAAIGTLQGLAGDGQVGEAAAAALDEIRQRRKKA